MQACAVAFAPSRVPMIRFVLLPFRFPVVALPLAGALLSACVSPDPVPLPGPEPSARPTLSWSVTHSWPTRRWAMSTVSLSVNGVPYTVGQHASKESPLVPVEPGSLPGVVPAEAWSAAGSFSSGGTVYYYALPDGARRLAIFQHHTNDAGREAPRRVLINTIVY